MRLPSINNDQNIGRVLPKMNDDFQHESNAKLPDCVDSLTYFNETSQNNTNFEIDEVPNCPYNQIYPYCSETEEVSSSDVNCQTAESEVKSLKEWLILHNDLIQQQNDEILDKEHQIFLLQRENEMLKERLNCLEKGIPFDPAKHFNQVIDNIAEDSLSEDMTQDSCGQYEEESKENIELVNAQQSDNVVTCSLEVTNYELNHISDVESQVDTTIDEDIFPVEESEFKSEDYIGNDLSDSFKTESDTAECNKDSLSEYNFTVNNFCEFDPMKNIKMSIRRKRVSSSSVLSSSEPTLLGEKKTLRRIKKKRRRSAKDIQIMTSKEPYYLASIIEDIPSLVEPEIEDLTGDITLEVPRWRVKHYTSCYTMEGTENLDDDVYNKRHMRLEIDERRRKRWDVQRIREQRVIEKLKQRQEKIASGSKGENSDESFTSLWPKLEDVKFLEISEELPVSAFGHPVPKITINNFGLPWLNNPSALTRRSNSKRSSVGSRKRSKCKR